MRNDKIYQELSKKYNLPHQVVEIICNHPFKFASDVMSHPTDDKSIMLSYLFKFKLKKKFGNDKQKTRKDLKNEEETNDI